MTTTHSGNNTSTNRVLDDFSLEATGKDIDQLHRASSSIPPGTRINVTFLAHEDSEARLRTARAARDLGFTAVPHISARRLASAEQLDEFLTALSAAGNHENVFVIAGDPDTPQGPYADALAVLDSGMLQMHGVRNIGIAGYPEGHPDIPPATLWSALERKAAWLTRNGLPGSIITQFGFDIDAVLRWVEAVRDRGIDLPIRVGVPGPAGVKRLLGYASRFGVSTSATITRKYGISLTNLLGTAGPDRFMTALAAGYDAGRHGDLKVHFYPFGDLVATLAWVQAYRGVAAR